MIVNGQVFLADTGETAIGVIIEQKGTNNGANTDINGRFVINVPVGAVLLIKMLGYKDVQIIVTSTTKNLKIDLVVDTYQLPPIEITNKPKKNNSLWWLLGGAGLLSLFLISPAENPKEYEV